MKKFIIICTAMLFTLSGFSQKLKWASDYMDALQIAKEQNKTIIIFFTDASDIKKESIVKKKIFNSGELKALSKKFIFLEIDESNPEKLSSKEKVYNNRMISAYNSKRKFPAIQVISKEASKKSKLITRFNTKQTETFISYLKTL